MQYMNGYTDGTFRPDASITRAEASKLLALSLIHIFSITCSAADALLQFAAESGETGTIESMTAGYRMQTDSSRRIRLTPTWKIDTETGEYLVDCDKKTIIGEEN